MVLLSDHVPTLVSALKLAIAEYRSVLQTHGSRLSPYAVGQLKLEIEECEEVLIGLGFEVFERARVAPQQPKPEPDANSKPIHQSARPRQWSADARARHSKRMKELWADPKSGLHQGPATRISKRAVILKGASS